MTNEGDMVPGTVVRVALEKSDMVVCLDCVATDQLSIDIAKDLIYELMQNNRLVGVRSLEEGFFSHYTKKHFVDIGDIKLPETDNQLASVTVNVGDGCKKQTFLFLSSPKTTSGHFMFHKETIVKTIGKMLGLET